jgi:hypothetical protein
MLIAETVPLNSARVLGFDTDTKLTARTAGNLALAGFSFGKRYVGLEIGHAPGDLDAVEVGEMTDAGLSVMSVQHGRAAGWSQATGASDGQAAAVNHLATGLPADVTLSCDLEGEPMSVQQAIDYGGAWYGRATAEGCSSLELYVGAGVPLTGGGLYHSLPFTLYWKSGSDVPDVWRRGYATIQLSPFDQLIAGVDLDLDVIGSDRLGNRPRWARKQ